MKYLFRNIACAILLLSLFNCSTESVDFTQDENLLGTTENTEVPSIDTTCHSQDPKARVTNNGTLDVSFQIYNESGVLVGHEHDVEPGETSNWKTFASGEITFVVSNSNSDKVIVLDMDTCMAYDMVIGTNNQLDSDQAVNL